MKTLCILAVFALLGSHIGMWLGATHASASLFNASFVVYVMSFFATFTFSAVAWAEDCPSTT